MRTARLVVDDLPALAGLYRQFWGEDSALDKMQATFRRLDADPAYVLLGAEHDGHLVGSAMGIVCEELYGECRPFLVVEDVVVDEGYRRRGVGTALMRALEEHARERGCAYVIFVTEQERTAAREFYRSLGYDPDQYRGFKKRLGDRPKHP